jgi:hypothetical protein
MPHRSIEQLREAEAKLVERLSNVRTEIREREAREMTRLATGYAKAIKAAKKDGGTMPTPEELAAMLTAAPAKPARRRRAATAAPRKGRKAAAA